MKSQSFRKIWLLFPPPNHIRNGKECPKGALTLISVFILFTFVTLGLSMLFLTQVYMKLSGYKKNAIILNYASENGIKQGFNQLVNALSLASSPIILSSEEADGLREDARNEGTQIIERLLGTAVPLAHSSGWEKLSWESSTNFSIMDMQEKDDYFQTEYNAEILSLGALKNFNPQQGSSLNVSMQIFTGYIPLPSIPLLINKDLTPEQKENFLDDNRIEMLSSENSHLSPSIYFSAEKLLSNEANSQLSKALKIEIVQPRGLSVPLLRSALGLELSNEPVPDGVYLVEDNSGLGGVYVQGDLIEMVLAVEDDVQVVSFRSELGTWVLKFNPVQSQTWFFTPTGTFTYESVPRGIIIVNGEIGSLGGGIANASGEILLVKDAEVPCLLNSVSLTIISSHKITLSSHLIHQGVRWEQGIPAIKESSSQLHIFATGRDFTDSSEHSGQILIAQDSPQELKIQASLTASKNGFSIEGTGKSVLLYGSLHTADYSANDNKLIVAFDERFLGEDDLLINAPKTVKPILHLTLFKATEWIEN